MDGSSPHLQVNAALSKNLVTGAKASSWGPAKGEEGNHGTHVAGIVAAHGQPPSGLRGVAPAAEIVSYRVFPDSGGATNFDIMKAIDKAANDECDILNLSLGSTRADPVLRRAIEHARSRGCVVVAASGNDGRQPVNYPAAWRVTVAVSALGQRGTFPRSSTETADIARPYGRPNRKRFMAAFSNIGPEIDLVGPGVGVISTVPGGYAAMSGTSMACPAVAGCAAALLSRNPAIKSMPRDLERAEALEKLLFQSVQSQRMGPHYEGFGLALSSSDAAIHRPTG